MVTVQTQSPAGLPEPLPSPEDPSPLGKVWIPGGTFGMGAEDSRRVLKSGSFLRAPNYCLRYCLAAPQGEAVDASRAISVFDVSCGHDTNTR